MEFKFKDTKFMSAVEKVKVIRAWEAFLKSGCHKQYFTEALYHHLIQHCSFIAHYDRAGFYATYFDEPEDTAHFLTQFDDSKGPPKSIEYGDTYWVFGGNDVVSEYHDINVAMCKVAAIYAPALVAFARVEQQDIDVARAKALLAKHGLELKEVDIAHSGTVKQAG